MGFMKEGGLLVPELPVVGWEQLGSRIVIVKCHASDAMPAPCQLILQKLEKNERNEIRFYRISPEFKKN